MFKNFYNTLISNNGLRATFIVVFVATMLTVYELSMFYFVVVPKVNSQIKEGILNISKNLKKTDLLNIDNLYESKINTFKSVFKTFQERENVLIDKINMYTVYTAFFMLIFLSILLLIIKNKLNERGENIGKCVWILSFITLFLIGIFQYAFYIFGNKYNYLGSEGQEELLYNLLSKLK
jgi:hypothetical protein